MLVLSLDCRYMLAEGEGIAFFIGIAVLHIHNEEVLSVLMFVLAV